MTQPTPSAASSSERSIQQAALWVAMLGAFFTPFMGAAVNIALPAIGREFTLPALGLNWVATAYLLSAALFLVPFGRLADIVGRKKIYTWGVGVYTLASALCAMAPSGGMLIAFRIVQGLGGAMIFGTGVAILTSVFPAGKRGSALGIAVSATYLGLSLGPVLGGFLTEQLGWRSIFWINVPLGLAVMALIFWKLAGEWAEAKGETFDWTGSLWYGVGLVALIYGFSRLPGTAGLVALGVALAGLGIFVWQERRIRQPVLDLELFLHNRVFAMSTLAALINYSATFAVGFLLSLYLQYIQALSPAQAGLILIVQPVIMAVFSPLAGKTSDRVEARVVASLGMALTAAGLLLLLAVNATTPTAFLLASLALMGFGFALFSSPNTNAVMGSVERRHFGVASATLGTMRLTGQMLSMGMTMLVMAVYLGHDAITPANHGRFLASLHTTFLIFSMLCVAGVFASLARGRNLPRSGGRGGSRIFPAGEA